MPQVTLPQGTEAYDEPEDGLHGDDRVAVGQSLFLHRIRALLVHDDDVISQCNPGRQKVVEATTIGRNVNAFTQ